MFLGNFDELHTRGLAFIYIRKIVMGTNSLSGRSGSVYISVCYRLLYVPVCILCVFEFSKRGIEDV